MTSGPTRIRRFLGGCIALLRKRQVEQDLDEELHGYLDAAVAEHVRRGMPHADALRAARAGMGSMAAVKDYTRDVGWETQLEHLWRDIRHAGRTLRRAPAFTATAVLTLALGIGATTAIFSVINGVLLRPLPYPDADRIVRFVENVPATDGANVPGQRAVGIPMADLAAFRAQASTLSHIGAYAAASTLVTVQGRTVRLDIMRISPALFAMVHAQPFVGRSFGPADETPGHDGVAILSHGAWQRFFGGAPDVVGKAVTIDGRRYDVIGVMPGEFRFPDAETQVWVPYALGGASLQARVPLVARLTDGVSLEAATAEVVPILHALTARPPRPAAAPAPAPAAPQFALVGAQEQLVAPVRPALLVLAGAVAFVLLIACVNVTSLLLARTAARRREMAVRAALGAGRGRLVRQMLTESLLLAMGAGVVGVALAYGGLHVMRALGTSVARRDMAFFVGLPRLDEVGMDVTVLLFALGTSAVAGVLAGLAPALRHSTSVRPEALWAGAASAEAGFDIVGRRQRAQGLLIVTEIALATSLLVGGGLLAHSFVNLLRVNPGYDARGVLTFQVFSPRSSSPLPPGPSRDAALEHAARFSETLAARLPALPGVEAAGYAELLPLVRFRSGVSLRKTPEFPAAPTRPPAPGARLPPESPDARVVSWAFMQTMGMRMLAGRGLSEADGPDRPKVMVINETLARSGFFDGNPVGAHVYAAGREPWEVVGIVEDVRQYGLDQAADPQIFMDARQLPFSNPSPYFVVRTAADPAAVLAQVRGAVEQLEPDALVDSVATMEQLLWDSISRPRLYAVLLGLFAAVAVALAAIGIYGVMAYAVTRRTREIGIRMALGAERSAVTRLIVGQSLGLIAAGTVAGLAGAVALTRYLRTMLFEVAPLDAPTFAGMSALFVVVALLAAVIPARRAMRVDPVVALRCE